MCRRCGAHLETPSGAAVFLCPGCRVAYEPGMAGLREVPVVAAAAALAAESAETGTTGPVPIASVQHVAAWRFPASVEVRAKRSASARHPGSVWETVRRAAAPAAPVLYAPASERTEMVVRLLGTALVEAQPRLSVGGLLADPSPIVFTEEAARAVAEYVYLALEVRRTSGLEGIDYELSLGPGELVFLPTVRDRRWPQLANRRLLLAELE